MLNFMALYWPQGEKRIPMNLGSQFATLVAIEQAKNAQSWPQVFAIQTPSLKWALERSFTWKWRIDNSPSLRARVKGNPALQI
jgi:hypothetical protein